eukprot:6205458-Pleurochrysis_carterae.AAC.1
MEMSKCLTNKNKNSKDQQQQQLRLGRALVNYPACRAVVLYHDLHGCRCEIKARAAATPPANKSLKTCTIVDRRSVSNLWDADNADFTRGCKEAL